MTPSSSNLKRCRISTESNCILCNKVICTTAHILSGCSVARSQGRYTFRHDSVLNELHRILKSFIAKLCPLKVTKPNRIDFVKQGTVLKTPCKRILGILHSANDWKMQCDLGGKYMFPLQIAITSLRPDVVIFSAASRKVVLIELTCPCEENMTERHVDKVGKYECLCETIVEAGWELYFFAVEVGARGYCATTLSRMLRRLGFSNAEVRKSSGALALISMQCSFFVWQMRNNRKWSNPELNTLLPPRGDVGVTSPSTPTSVDREPLSSTPRKNSTVLVSREKLLMPAGFKNMGNSCFIGAILQVFSVIPKLWCKVPSETSDPSPIARSLSRLMSLKKRTNKPLDPSSFLWALRREVPSFRFHQQYDAHEVLTHILNALLAPTSISQDLVCCVLKITMTCKKCFQSYDTEDTNSILSIPVNSSVKSSIMNHLSEESISGDPCLVCDGQEGWYRETAVVSCGEFLIVHLKRFDNNLKKINSKVSCVPDSLEIPVYDRDETIGNISLAINCDSVYFSAKYSLCATINHSGSLSSGHYWSYVRDRKSNQWYSCDDEIVSPVIATKLNNCSNYIFFYERK